MFEKQFNRRHAIALREHGFSATQISEFLGCSVSWLYNVIKQKPDEYKVKKLMQSIIKEADKEYQCMSVSCVECGAEFTQGSDYSSSIFCSDLCHGKHVLEDSLFEEIYGKTKV